MKLIKTDGPFRIDADEVAVTTRVRVNRTKRYFSVSFVVTADLLEDAAIEGSVAKLLYDHVQACKRMLEGQE